MGPANSNPAYRTRVLVVDDEESIRSLLRRSLERASFEVVGEASNGVDGVKLVSELQPDVVILDSRMPAMGGEEAAGLMKQGAPQVAIVAFSGELRECPSWADAYLNKGSSGLIQSLLMVVGVATLGRTPGPAIPSDQ
jgi:two-component system nitrate/nitrite response regulator NarL